GSANESACRRAKPAGASPGSPTGQSHSARQSPSRDRRARRRPARTAMHATDERTYHVDELTRVEGEGSLHLRVREGEVVEARLRIFEAPRFFERIVVGRTHDEVIDIVARICGICPIAYQPTAAPAF